MKTKIDPRIAVPHYNAGKEDLPFCIICDLDGTLALINGRSPYDHEVETDIVNYSVLHVLRKFNTMPIVIFSGREDKALKSSKKWLNNHMVPYTNIVFRKTGDTRKDSTVKQEMFEQHIHGKYRVLFVLDDRNQVVDMWRNLGIDCFQVYYGDF